MSSLVRVSTETGDLRKIESKLVLQPVDGISRATGEDLDQVISSEITSLRGERLGISSGSTERKLGCQAKIAEESRAEGSERTDGFLRVVKERFGGILDSSGGLSFGTGTVDSGSRLRRVSSPERILREAGRQKRASAVENWAVFSAAKGGKFRGRRNITVARRGMERGGMTDLVEDEYVRSTLFVTQVRSLFRAEKDESGRGKRRRGRKRSAGRRECRTDLDESVSGWEMSYVSAHWPVFAEFDRTHQRAQRVHHRRR